MCKFPNAARISTSGLVAWQRYWDWTETEGMNHGSPQLVVSSCYLERTLVIFVDPTTSASDWKIPQANL